MSDSNRREADGSSPPGTSAVKIGSWLSAIGARPSKGIVHVHLMITVILQVPSRSSQSIVPVTNWSGESTLEAGAVEDREAALGNCFRPITFSGETGAAGNSGPRETSTSALRE